MAMAATPGPRVSLSGASSRLSLPSPDIFAGRPYETALPQAGRLGGRIPGCLVGGSPAGHRTGSRQRASGGRARSAARHQPARGTEPAASVQVVPAPWPGRAAVSFPAEPESILAIL